jgi:hypothetical protein
MFNFRGAKARFAAKRDRYSAGTAVACAGIAAGSEAGMRLNANNSAATTA